MNNEFTKILATAGQFDVHTWSDYPEVKAVTDALFERIVAHRKSRNARARIAKAEQLKKHLRVLLIDLYVASQSPNPWRGISKRKPDYQEESRYRKIYLKYDLLIPLVDDLCDMGFVEQVVGFKDHRTNKGYRTRIRATDSLIKFIEADQFGIPPLTDKVGIAGLLQDNPETERETIVLRDANGLPLEYEETEATQLMRENLRVINKKLSDARIVLKMPNDEWAALRERLESSDDDREFVDFSRKSLHRVFNGDFEHGGRFYGGWWIGLPKEYRKYVEIGRKHSVEVDFSAHHIRMLYAWQGYKPPVDPYQIEGCPFSRETLKRVFLILINANDRDSTVRACAQKGIKKSQEILKYLEKEHGAISKYFYSGMGLTLQYEDSQIAEDVMLQMAERGAVVLPVHDSFIVRASYEQELIEVMNEAFGRKYGIKPVMKTKATVYGQELSEGENTPKFVTLKLNELSEDLNKYSETRKMFGI